MKVANVNAAREREIAEFKIQQDEAIAKRDIEKHAADPDGRSRAHAFDRAGGDRQDHAADRQESRAADRPKSCKQQSDGSGRPARRKPPSPTRKRKRAEARAAALAAEAERERAQAEGHHRHGHRRSRARGRRRSSSPPSRRPSRTRSRSRPTPTCWRTCGSRKPTPNARRPQAQYEAKLRLAEGDAAGKRPSVPRAKGPSRWST